MMKRQPDFDGNILKVLKKQAPSRPTLFEFSISEEAEEVLSGYIADKTNTLDKLKTRIKAFYNAGYDFVPLMGSDFVFKRNQHKNSSSFSLNDFNMITDSKDFEKYIWNNPSDYSYELLENASKLLPDGMKFMIYAPDGTLENVIGLTGFDNLCYMLSDDRDLVKQIFENVGKRLIKYYEICASFESVGILFANDDWGFKNSTMLSHSDLKEFVYPYHKQIVDIAHKNGKMRAMHSCGNFSGIYDDLYNVLGFDGKHSNEDTILPVETAYENYGGKIAILGGIDVDFLCRAGEVDIEKRCHNMLEMAKEKGGYALGSGNSIAPYVPLKNYIAMIKSANPDFKI